MKSSTRPAVASTLESTSPKTCHGKLTLIESAKKAYSTQAFLQHNIKSCPKKIKAQCFTTFVRPVLEYAFTVWAPHHKSDIDKLEAVQRRAARLVMRDYHRTSSVTNMLCQLNWPTLQHCTNVSKLVMLYKIKHRTVDVPPGHLLLLNKRTDERPQPDTCITHEEEELDSRTSMPVLAY